MLYEDLEHAFTQDSAGRLVSAFLFLDVRDTEKM